MAKEEGYTAAKIVQLIYHIGVLPLVGFIAIQTYQINANQHTINEKIKHIEYNQHQLIIDQRKFEKNQNLLCNYAEPTWPTHSKCER